MDPDVLLDKTDVTVRKWLTYGNAIGMAREWKQNEADMKAERSLRGSL